jgi:uncharacterized protein YrzB (UPF0473 family)
MTHSSDREKAVDKQSPDYLNELAEAQNMAPEFTGSQGLGSNQLVVTNDEGLPVICDIILTFESENNGKHYIIYTDNSIDEDGSMVAFAATYDPSVEGSALYELETDEDWMLVDAVMAQMAEEEDGFDTDDEGVA